MTARASIAEKARRAAWLFAAVLSSACAQTTDTAKAPSSGAVGASLQQIDDLIGAAPCRSDADCRVIGVGTKACGGPQTYRAWSAAATDAGALRDLVDRYSAQHAAELRRQGVRSTCDITPVPAVVCQAAAAADGSGRCALVTGRGLPIR